MLLEKGLVARGQKVAKSVPTSTVALGKSLRNMWLVNIGNVLLFSEFEQL